MRKAFGEKLSGVGAQWISEHLSRDGARHQRQRQAAADVSAFAYDSAPVESWAGNLNGLLGYDR